MIEVNEYVRTKNGVIDKVDALYGMIENTVHLENQKWFDTKNSKPQQTTNRLNRKQRYFKS